MIRSTFSGFNMALSGMNASQKALDVVGQNITNMNTTGYTRQRLDLYSIKGPGPNAFSFISETKVGQGVMMQSVSQLRDPYLDYQYRTQLAKVGTQDAINQVLGDIGTIFDQVDTTNVQEALDDIVSQLQDLSTKVGQDGADGLVREAFGVMVDFLHQNASSLDDIREDLTTKLQESIGPQVNSILEQISALNDQIKRSEILGDPALELRDTRNLLLDDLATYLPIEVSTRQVSVGGGVTVEELDVRIKGTDEYLITHDQTGSISFADNGNGGLDMSLNTFKMNHEEAGDQPNPAAPMDTSQITEGIIYGNLQMLNSDGIKTGETKGIGYYEALLDSFAYTIATKMNELNNTGNTTGTPKDLFEASDGNTITAATIQLSEEWMNGTIGITNSSDPDSPTGNDVILQMKDLLSTKNDLEFVYVDRNGDVDKDTTLYTGTMPGAYTNIQNMQGMEKSSTEAALANRVSVMNEIADSRDSVMGVSLDEEVMDLLRFQQSYSAAARVMTTMDEALDTLINKTGVVGR